MRDIDRIIDYVNDLPPGFISLTRRRVITNRLQHPPTEEELAMASAQIVADEEQAAKKDIVPYFFWIDEAADWRIA